MAEFFTTTNLIALVTLTSLEVVLGIDNIIFIAILASRLPEDQRDKARKLGLALAVISRVILLLGIGWVMELKKPLLSLFEHSYTGKDLVLLIGGAFLIAKSTHEIHHKVAALDHGESHGSGAKTMRGMLIQVMFIDVVFSLDSVITAVGMCHYIPTMVAAILTSVGIMLWFSGPIVKFVDRHPAIKLLALSFLLLIGVLLVAEGFHQEISKGYVYFAMAFSLAIELLQMQTEKNISRKQAHQHAHDSATTTDNL